MSKVKLPMELVPASSKSPRNLIIISKPKVGKTSNLAQLPNSLLLDLEKGSDFVDARKLQAKNMAEIKEIGDAIKAAEYPYQYIIIDTGTALEEMCIPYAEQLYSQKAVGKNWFKKDPKKPKQYSKLSGKKQYGNILNLPKGAGYVYLREAMVKTIEYIKGWAPRVIICAHIKDVLLDKQGSEFTVGDIDLTGKIKRIITSQSDAIGFMYRGKNNENILSFVTNDDVICGARPAHLRNKEIVISKLLDDDTLETYWDRVFID